MEEKSVLISKDIHDKVKKVSKESGISIKHIVEKGIEIYLARLKRREDEDFDIRRNG